MLTTLSKDLADIFYEFHLKAVEITDEECKNYNINREKANLIVDTIRKFANEFYNQKLNNTLLNINKNFPKEAMQYNRNNLSIKEDK